MFLVNKKNKTLTEIEETNFTDLGFEERYDIQEWICSNPKILQEDLLIISKEFNKFENTKERLDLLALDKSGNLVVIENKRDDSGRDVTWQAIKYASYCSTMLKKQVIEIYQEYLDKLGTGEKAEENIEDFYYGCDSVVYPSDRQRIILVSHKFRKEVLSAADWLLHNNIDIKCVSIKPFLKGEDIIVDTDIILPQEEIKEYTLKVADKAQDLRTDKRIASESAMLYKEFWQEFDKVYDNKAKTSMCDRNFSNNTNQWIGGSAGMTGPRSSFNFVATQSGCRVELFIDANKGRDLNKKIFDYLLENKEEIAKVINFPEISWERNDNKISSRISIRNNELDVSDKNQWNEIFEFFKSNIENFEKAFKPFTKQVCEISYNWDK